MSDEPKKVAYALPSEAAKAGRWDLAQELAKPDSWDEADAEALADVVEALFPSPMSCPDGIDHGTLEEWVIAAHDALDAGLRWVREERQEGCVDLYWLPYDVRDELIYRWKGANPYPNKKESRQESRPPLDPMCCIDEFGSVPYPEYTSLLGAFRQSGILEEEQKILLNKIKENNS